MVPLSQSFCFCNFHRLSTLNMGSFKRNYWWRAFKFTYPTVPAPVYSSSFFGEIFFSVPPFGNTPTIEHNKDFVDKKWRMFYAMFDCKSNFLPMMEQNSLPIFNSQSQSFSVCPTSLIGCGIFTQKIRGTETGNDS